MTRLSFDSPLNHRALLGILAILTGAACGGHSSTDTGGVPSPPANPPGDDPPPAGIPLVCDAAAASDIAVSSNDLNGFPPYAAAGCTLVYVSSAGELVVRNLATREDTTVAPATEHPRRPTASLNLIAWEADQNSHSVVRVRKDGVVKTVAGAFVSAGEPRASGSSVAFTAWNGPSTADDTDIWLYDGKTDSAHLVLGGPGQQRFSDISSAYIAATDFSEDPDGRYDNDGKDLADIIVLDRMSGVVTTRRLPGKQAFPMLANGGVLAYLEWNGIHPEPKFVDYALRSGAVVGDPTADIGIAQVVYQSSEYARPALVGGTLEWIANPNGNTVLYRAAADGSTPPVAVKGLENLWLYAPAPSAVGSGGFTILATQRVGSTELIPRLRAVAR